MKNNDPPFLGKNYTFLRRCMPLVFSTHLLGTIISLPLISLLHTCVHSKVDFLPQHLFKKKKVVDPLITMGARIQVFFILHFLFKSVVAKPLPQGSSFLQSSTGGKIQMTCKVRKISVTVRWYLHRLAFNIFISREKIFQKKKCIRSQFE